MRIWTSIELQQQHGRSFAPTAQPVPGLTIIEYTQERAETWLSPLDVVHFDHPVALSPHFITADNVSGGAVHCCLRQFSMRTWTSSPRRTPLFESFTGAYPKVANEHRGKRLHRLALTLYVDGFPTFNRKYHTSISVYLSLGNLPRSKRMARENMPLLACIPPGSLVVVPAR